MACCLNCGRSWVRARLLFAPSAKHAALRSKGKYWLDRNRDNVAEWNEMSTSRLLLQWASYHYKHLIKPVGLVQSRHHHHNFIECNLFSPWYSWKIAHLALNNNHSLTIWRNDTKYEIQYISYMLMGQIVFVWY